MTVTGLLFMVVFLAALAVALLRYPIVGLFAYVGVFYLHPPSRWWGAFLPDLRWSFLAAGVTLLAIWWRLPADKNRPAWYATTPAKIMILFVAWFWLESLWALDGVQHRVGAVLITKYLLVYYMVYRLVDTPDKRTAFLMAHLLGCLYLGFLGFGAGSSGRLDGVGGPGIDDSNTLGMQLATGVVVGAMLTLHLRGWRQALCIVAIAFSMNTIVLTGSRGAFLALVAGGLALAYMRPNAYRRMFYVYSALGVVLFSYVASEQFWQRMDTVTAAVDDSKVMDGSAESRIEMIKAQFKMAALHPLGSGHRGSEVMSTQFLDSMYMSEFGARSSHNVFMTVLVEQGIPGVIMLLAMIGWVVMTLRRVKREAIAEDDTPRMVHAAAIAGALTVVFIGGMFADFSKCEVQIWMFALLAALAHHRTQAVTSLAGTDARCAMRSKGEVAMRIDLHPRD